MSPEGILDLGALMLGGGVTGEGSGPPAYTPLAYPLPQPGFGLVAIEWLRDEVRGRSESPFTLHRQVVTHPGERIRAQIALAPMPRDKAEELAGLLLSLSGGAGTFYFGDVLNPTPRGSAAGIPVVDGDAQVGKVLKTRGWASNVAGILKAFDKVQLGSNLYFLMRDANTDGDGVAYLDIFPRLRIVPTDGQTLITTSPKGLFRLSAAGGSLLKTDMRGFFALNGFEIIEAF
jgi:hypothetical protein